MNLAVRAPIRGFDTRLELRLGLERPRNLHLNLSGLGEIGARPPQTAGDMARRLAMLHSLRSLHIDRVRSSAAEVAVEAALANPAPQMATRPPERPLFRSS